MFQNKPGEEEEEEEDMKPEDWDFGGVGEACGI
jgi:hypothetical protein